MTIFDMLFTTLLGPLKLVFEVIYVIANRVIGHPGLAIVVLSLIMNFLVLPLYKRSDAMQEEARDIDAKLSKGVNHIKKTFSGDERMMIMQTYYRQNNYKPTDALNGSVSLLLEVPFFMAAYQFLSGLEMIQGVSLGPIADLGAPDAMLVIGGMSINLLPILMTLVNIISSAIYLKGFPLKTKIQLYGMAIFFLVFLYTSPAGLVFYWTLNNVFSLVKTIFYKLKNPKKVLSILASIVGVVVLVFGIGFYETVSIKRKLFMMVLGVALQIPTLITLLERKISIKGSQSEEKNNKKFFIVGCLFLTVLVGGLIPSTLIAASPQEFIDITYFYNPVWYMVSALCLAAGTFLVWFGVFYWIAGPKGKVLFDKIVGILCGVMLVNYMFFGTNLGVISKNLKYENGMSFESSELILNCLSLVVISIVMFIIVAKFKSKICGIVLTAVIAIAAMSGVNVFTIQESVSAAESQLDKTNNQMPQFNLSKTGKNVIVLMLDRGMGQYIPYIMNEKPELQEQFAGFTYYSNTISFGGFTNFGTPALFGGYEYTPVEMNKREEEALVDKHNEALKVMPVLFAQNGYDVTVCDVPYANYQWIPDMSIYDEYPEIDTYITEGKFSDVASKAYQVECSLRDFFCFSLMKTMPLVIQNNLYEDGNYNRAEMVAEDVVYSNQILQSETVADNMSGIFMNAYNVLVNLPYMTKVTDDETNTFLMMNNNTTHEPMMLQVPEYEPAQHVDNTEFYEQNQDLYTLNGVTLEMDTYLKTSHYQTNMAVLIQLGKWFEWMRENDVYDNTRIIIVSDHGRPLYQIDDLLMEETLGGLGDIEFYYPLLMVKDFDSEGFETIDEFMTQADVPTIAVKDVIDNAVNPFTGKEISNEEKTLHDQYVIASWDYEVTKNNGNVFLPSKWYAVSDNIWNLSNWRLIDEEVILPDELEE